MHTKKSDNINRVKKTLKLNKKTILQKSFNIKMKVNKIMN